MLSLKTVRWGLWLIAFIYAFYIYVIVPTDTPQPDLAVYIKSAQVLASGGDIYSHSYPVTFGPDHTFSFPYLYPPFLAHVFTYFLSWNERSLQLAWNVFGFFSICVSILCVTALISDSWWGKLTFERRLAIVSFFTLCFDPLYQGVIYGQVTGVVLMCLSAFALCCVKGRERLAGVALALAIHLKLAPALLLLAPLVFGKRQTALWCGMTTALCVVATGVELGSFRPFADFLVSLPTASNHETIQKQIFNFRVTGAILGLVGLSNNSIAHLVLNVLTTALAVFGVVFVFRQDEKSYLRAIALLIVAMLAISPVLWSHHFAWAIIPIAVATMRTPKTQHDLLRNLTFSLGIYFCMNKAFLIHITVMREYPGALPISALLPTMLLLALAGMLYRFSKRLRCSLRVLF